MKVLLVNPPGISSKYKRDPFINFSSMPLGLAYIGAVLEKDDVQVEAVDCPAIEVDSAQLTKHVERTRPDVVGIQALTTSIYSSVETADNVKRVSPETHVVLGGYHPTFCPEQTLNLSKSIDTVVRGDGEYTFLKLVKMLEQKGSQDGRTKIRGLTFREGKKTIHTPNAPLIKDLDALPFPARHLFPNDKYSILGLQLPSFTMVSSRGCPFGCSFCAVSAFYGSTWRPRSPQSVVSEIEAFKPNRGVYGVAFMDDMFALNEKRTLQICGQMKQRNTNCIWGATVRADTVTYNLLRAMHDAGCVIVFLGVETGEQAILDKIRKGETVEQMKRILKWTSSIGIDTVASVAFGLPGETKKSIVKTIDYVNALKPDHAIFALATPYPGTKFYTEAVEKGWIVDSDFSNYTLFKPLMETSNITKEDLKSFLKYAYIKFHLNPTWLPRRLIREARVAATKYGMTLYFKNLAWLMRSLKRNFFILR
jgi:radical SAM superfamily enzyme YgiQ (UPF0313 family)